jgi:pyridoxamine 5'-phosphate oxidase
MALKKTAGMDMLRPRIRGFAMPTADFNEPFDLFTSLLAEARIREPSDPEAVTLATAAPDGTPSARMVLLRGNDGRGFVFFTNYDSRKGDELFANPRAALCFHWKSIQRQVRIEGRAEPVSAAEGDAYFATRARESQLAAWVSDQSRELESRAVLEARFKETERRFAGGPVPRPPRWSGFRIVPDRFEFWEGRPHRLHDRIFYVRDGEGWRTGRLYP